MKAYGFKICYCFIDLVYGEIWSEDGNKLGSSTSIDVDSLKEDLKHYSSESYEYEFLDHIPEFVMKELIKRYEHKT